MSNGLSGGHLEEYGLTPAGQVVEVPLHRHVVDLDLTRYEFSLSRTFNENDVLQDEKILPGFRCSVAELFR